MPHPDHALSRFPVSRHATIDLGKVGRALHHVPVLLELDVTDSLEAVRQQRSAGEPTSFFAWFVGSVARVVAQEPAIHALRQGRTSLVSFSDVDVSAMVEREVNGKPVPLPLLMRTCNRKTFLEIHAEVRAAKEQPIASEGDFVLGSERKQRTGLKMYYLLPAWLRASLLRWLTRDPFRAKREMGTVVITSVGGLARAPGWFVPRSIHNLCLAMGAIVKKPWVVDGRVEPRDILHLTVLFNHDVIDGAPAARFLGLLADTLQGGYPNPEGERLPESQ